MTQLLIDTSVLIKWFHEDGEGELDSARAIRKAHVQGDLDAYIIDLALHEVGNVLARALRWNAGDIADQLDDLLTIIGPPLAMTPAWLRTAAQLAEDYTLSFYDASWAAAAVDLAVPLITADRRLLATGLAEPATTVATRLHLA